MNWRRLNRAVHRDLGYLMAALTVVYAFTGVLLNHLHDWNPHWSIERIETSVGALPPPERFTGADLERALTELDEREAPAGTFFRDPETLEVFFAEGRVLKIDLPTGKVSGEVVRERRMLAFLDALHLNRAGAAWTWLADIYAGSLLVMALTGLFVLKGGNGITRRGAVLTLAGIAIPILLLVLANAP